MTGIEGTAIIQLGRPQVPLQIAVECQLLEGLNSHCRPIADLAEYEIDVWKPLLKAPFSTKEPDPMLRIARSVLNA